MILQPGRIYRIDALDGLRRLEDGSVDLVLTDPPYNVASEHATTVRKGKIVSTMEAWGAWDCLHPFDYDVLIDSVISQSFRVLKPGGALVMFTAREDNGHFVRRAVTRGFTYRNQLVLAKRNPLPSFAKANWRSGYEIALYVTKGKPMAWNFPGQPESVNVIPYSNTKRQSAHPTEKPLDIISRIVLACSNEGDLVVDPFMGSGTTAVAAKKCGRRFLGFDTSAEYVAMARHRLKHECGRARDATGRPEAIR